MTKCTEFVHHPVKVLKELFLNDGETAKIIDNKATLRRESGTSVSNLFFDKGGNLVFMPDTTGPGVVIDIVSRTVKNIAGKNMTCNCSIS